ncbi:MAG: right-handed parallel beta-helix repeat-containing protein, partial [Candidatus Heimdallarchaeaceae archaeon]
PCLSNYWGGIMMIQSSNNTVKQNTCKDSGNSDGITMYLSSNITIIENTCEDNRNSGIETWRSEYLIILNNTLSNNRFGIFCGPASFFTISFNTIKLSKQEGIVLISSSDGELSENSTFTFNTFTNNTSYGIAIYAGSHNVIHHNSFAYNNQINTQGFDSGTSNYWYDVNLLEGNFWNDWLSGNYVIDGSAGAQDIYPLSSSPI